MIPAMLASVRNLAEAKVVVAENVDWVDLKEPNDGALGAVKMDTIVEIADWMRGQSSTRPLSATIGDCWNDPVLIRERSLALGSTQIDYIKIGLYAASPQRELLDAIRASCAQTTPVILVCFAEAPPSSSDIARYASLGVKGMMLDTANKRGQRLTQLVTQAELARFAEQSHRHDLICGLAGSLREEDIPPLLSSGADYLGFRGALCVHGRRESTLSPERTRSVRGQFASSSSRVPNRSSNSVRKSVYES